MGQREKQGEKSLVADLSDLDRAVAFRITKLGRLMRAQLLAMMQTEDFGLTPEQFLLLFKLNTQDGIPQVSLADQVLQDHPNITRLLDSMEKKGLVRRGADPSDRRRSLVYLEPTGRQLFDRLAPFIKRERERLYAGISERELTQLLRLLDKLEKNALGH